MRRKPYKAMFLLPAQSKKDLGEFGWEFESNHCLDPKIVDKLLMEFSELVEGNEDKDCYRTEDLIIDVVKENNEIEHIYIRDYSDSLRNIDKVKNMFKSKHDLEVFIP